MVHSLFKEYHSCARSFSPLPLSPASSLSRPARAKKLLPKRPKPLLKRPKLLRLTLPLPPKRRPKLLLKPPLPLPSNRSQLAYRKGARDFCPARLFFCLLSVCADRRRRGRHRCETLAEYAGPPCR